MSAPSEPRAVEAMMNVQALSAKELDAEVTAEVGTPMLGVFHALASAMFPADGPEEIAKRVHLMVLAYLLRCRVESP